MAITWFYINQFGLICTMHETSITNTTAWKNLQVHYNQVKNESIRAMFDSNDDRFNQLSLSWQDFLVDYSKNRVSKDTIELLLQLAREAGVENARDAMFGGEEINITEKRAVLHTALRNRSNSAVFVGGQDVMPAINHELGKMKAFCEQIHSGNWQGFSGFPIKQIVNIGIGGSDLGPVMVTEALKPFQIAGIESYFVSNIDGSHT